jgi:phosphatidylinositol 4-kinase B
VLNSAERAPYLLLIEILHGDLDFDPSKRNNKELLKKIVSQAEQKRNREANEPSTLSAVPNHQVALQPIVSSEVLDLEPETPVVALTISPTTPRDAMQSMEPPEEEEMDLVEQLYGSGKSLRDQTVDMTDSIIVRPTPKNKALDVATWQKSTASTPPSPSPFSTPSLAPAVVLYPTSQSPSPLALSLEDYSERMRTAAVMLAQLNSNMIRETVTTLTAPDGTLTTPGDRSPGAAPAGGALSWIPGSGWITGAPSGSDAPAATRMRLQYTEAAAIRDRIMTEMMQLEEERMRRMKVAGDGESVMALGGIPQNAKTAEDEGIVRRELNKDDPSGVSDSVTSIDLIN